MSVVVIGMDKPKLCMECDFQIFSLDGDIYCKRFMRAIHSVHTQPPDWCPLRPLPEKHGRLIDGDELVNGCDDPHWCRWLSEIENMPTIVEAEGE